MRSLLGFALALPLVACAAVPAEEAASSDDAFTTTSSNVTFHEQASIPARLGRAVQASRGEDGRWSEGRVLGETCVVGDVHSTLDTMKEMGGTGLGFTAMANVGLPPDGHGSGLVRSGSNDAYFVEAKGDPVWAPTFTLADVAAFEEAMRATPTRLAGTVQARVDHNAFTLVDEHRFASGSSASCENQYVRTVTSKRFASFGFAIEFQSEADAQAFTTTFPDNINALLLTKPEPVAKFLVDHRAKIDIRVLTSVGLIAPMKAAIAGDVCSPENVAGCRALNDHLYAVTSKLAVLPGSDDRLEDLYRPDATWGIYELRTQSYDHVLPEEKSPGE